MKAFIVLVCLVGVAMAASAAKRASSSSKSPISSSTTTRKPLVNCDIDVSGSEEAILLPNPESCESYFVCDGGEAILMPCPDGLQFNPDLKVCDRPSEANCHIGW